MASGDPRGETDRLVDEAGDAFERAEVERALARAEEALRRDPGSLAAGHYRAAALAELGRLEEAREAYQRALEAGPEDLDLLAGAADFLGTAPRGGSRTGSSWSAGSSWRAAASRGPGRPGRRRSRPSWP